MSDSVDRTRLSKTLSFLLRHRPDAAGLKLDPDGWAPLAETVAGVAKLMKRPVTVEDLHSMLADARVKRFAIEDGSEPRIRAIADRRAEPKVQPPDILYHAVLDEEIAAAREGGQLLPDPRRPLFLSDDEAAAWRVVHRRRGDGQVLYVDSTRARRHGVRFRRHKRSDLYTADRLPLADVLNLQPRFGEQLSAGGLPVALGEDGNPRVALIRVTRRSGVTWEVAKGKLEIGETPEAAAVREVQEEMGIEVDLDITGYVGLIRYGFLAPGGLPRLKTVHLYLMRPTEAGLLSFSPRAAEGIADVRWFTPREACKAVTHTSLRPLMRTACDMILEAARDGRPLMQEPSQQSAQ